MATDGLPQPQVAAGISSNFPSAHLPVAAFVVIALSLALGWCFILTGALQVHWGLRFPVVALVTVGLGYYPVVQLMSDSGLSGRPFTGEVRLAWLQLGILGLFWVWSIGLLATEMRKGDRRRATAGRRRFPGNTFLLVSALVLIYEGATLGVWLDYRQAGVPLRGSVLADALTGQIFVLPLLLAVVIFWSSTDLIGWGELGARMLVTLARKVDGEKRTSRPYLLMILTGVAAAGIVIDVVRVYGRAALLSLVIAAALTVVVVLLAYWARLGQGWPVQMPIPTRLAGLAFMVGEFALVYPLGFALANWWGLPVDSAGPAIGVILGILVDVLAIMLGLILLARARQRQRYSAGATGLLLIMAALLVVVGNLQLVLAVLAPGGMHVPLHLLAGIRLLAALSVLILVVWLIAQPRSARDESRLLTAALLLLAGLQTIEWSFDVADAQTALGRISAVTFAAVFFVAVLWDVATSGEEITNADSDQFPRDGRVLLYLGYTMVAASVLLYSAAVQIPVAGALSPDALSSGNDAALGLLILGLPTVALGIALRFGGWLVSERRAKGSQ
jgi:hypothetical protein